MNGPDHSRLEPDAVHGGVGAEDRSEDQSTRVPPPSLTNNGRLFLEGNTVLTTVLTTGPGSLLRVRGTNTTSAANVTITANYGRYDLVSNGTGWVSINA